MNPGRERSRCAVWLLTGAAVCLLHGCGAAEYETRLKETEKQFAYFSKLNDNLSGPWNAMGVSLRMPKQFQAQIETIPADPEDPESKPVNVAAAPTFLGENVEILGVLGSWAAELPDESGGTAIAHAHVFGNHQLWLDEELGVSPADYHTYLPDLLKTAVETSAWEELTVTLPEAQPSFVAPNSFAKAIYAFANTEGKQIDVYLYLMQTGDTIKDSEDLDRNEIQIAILFAIPHTAVLSGTAGVVDPIPLALETLTVNPARPRPESQGGGPPPNF